MKKYDFIIVGAGVYGSAMAFLISHNLSSLLDILVIDKKDYVGGMCADEWQGPICVQKHGVHIFHTSNKKVWDFMTQFGNWNRFTNCVKAKDSEGKMYSLPFNMNTFYQVFGTSSPHLAKEAIKSEIEKENISEPKNLEEQAISMVGRTIYEKFIKEYTEKQWKAKSTELDPSIIKRIPVRYSYNNDYYNDIYEAMPENGFSDVIQTMLNRSNVEIQLSTPFSTEHLNMLKPNGKIIYTGSVDELFNYQYGPLDYRTTSWTYDTLPTSAYQGTGVVNFTAHKTQSVMTPFTRVAEFKFLDPLHRADEIESTIISEEWPEDYEVGKEPYYPIQNKENLEKYEQYKSLAKDSPQLILGGRLGDYKYYDMDKVIEKVFVDFEKLKNEYFNN